MVQMNLRDRKRLRDSESELTVAGGKDGGADR